LKYLLPIVVLLIPGESLSHPVESF